MKINTRTLTARGFTLIELLVVIAIIGILSAVVLASLNSASNKGADAAVKSNLGSVRKQALILYDSYGGKYNTDGSTGVAGAACPTTGTTMFANDTTIKNAIASAVKNGSGGALCYMSTTGTAYAIEVPLKTVTTNYWCVDSAGNSTSTPVAFTSATTKCGT